MKTAPSFKVAFNPLVLYGVHHKNADGTMDNRYPFSVPAGAFYGKDSRGYWVLIEKHFSARLTLVRFSIEGEKWYLSPEVGTETVRLILSKCQEKPELLKMPIVRHLSETSVKSDFTQKQVNGMRKYTSANVYHKSGELKRGQQYAAEQRLKESMKIQINPAEQSFSRLHDERPKQEAVERIKRRIQ